jgi:hypothetical protein
MGNLTLITKRLNSKLSNSGWKEKKKVLKDFSKLKLTTDYLDHDSWNESSIAERADYLSNKAIEIWKVEIPTSLISVSA